MLGVRGATPGKEKYRTLYTSIDERASESARGGVCVCVCVCVCALAPRPPGARAGAAWCSAPDLPVRMLHFSGWFYFYILFRVVYGMVVYDLHYPLI